jgi:hypothetical protein
MHAALERRGSSHLARLGLTAAALPRATGFLYERPHPIEKLRDGAVGLVAIVVAVDAHNLLDILQV